MHAEAADAAHEVGPTDAPRPPRVTPTAAPGVAFDYRYAFRLPANRIGAVQEQHAQACEKLGANRCRITGMSYTQNGENSASAQLVLKLEPALARRFGHSASEAVRGAEGEVASANIAGEDVGSRIEAEQEDQTEARQSLARIEGKLAQKGRGSSERAELQRQAQELRGVLEASGKTVAGQKKLLATTPMVFDYRAGETNRAFSYQAAKAFKGFSAALQTIAIASIYLAPWLLLALLGLFGWKWINRRFLGGGAPHREEAANAPAA
jgi:hypothetical protein